MSAIVVPADDGETTALGGALDAAGRTASRRPASARRIPAAMRIAAAASAGTVRSLRWRGLRDSIIVTVSPTIRTGAGHRGDSLREVTEERSYGLSRHVTGSLVAAFDRSPSRRMDPPSARARSIVVPARIAPGSSGVHTVPSGEDQPTVV